ncbi:Integrase (XerC) [uncultured Mediterranean phage uvMED]|nr:integrase [uncultured Mediterranean phage uvMED]BAQ87259.1 Integrase (XerC) [uncultured Mediterranean phage uvMED]BAQ87328.1 Integrase (XerC) [uncultured Mediterranean phage uvMED]
MAVLDYINSKTTIHKNDADRIDKLLKYFDNTEVNLINGYAFSGFVKSVIPKVKNDTVNRYRSNLVAVLNHAHGEQPHITINRIPTRKTEKPKPRYLSKEEAERLINAYNPILQPLIYFLAYQGARTAEALSLKWEDIDMDKRRVTLWNTKNGDYRSLPIHSRVYEALRGINRERSGFVFLTPSGKPYSYTTKKNGSPIKTAHKAALKRANIQQFKVHNWRSHWASRLVLDADASNYSLMALGGWRSPASVVHYINLNPDHLVNTLEKLE